MSEPELQASDLLYVSRVARVVGFLRRLLGRPEPVAVLQRRAQRGEELRKRLTWPERDESPEVIVIRLSKYHKYPEPDNRVLDLAASPWGKFEVKAINDDSLEVFDSIQSVRIRKGKAHYVSHDSEDARTVLIAARIPLERIAHINWDGDPAYSLPRLYAEYGWRGPARGKSILYERGDDGHLYLLYDVTLKGKKFSFWQRVRLNWQMRQSEKKFQREQWEEEDKREED